MEKEIGNKNPSVNIFCAQLYKIIITNGGRDFKGFVVEGGGLSG
jgi:hypothetical protein